jgi:hypothetical protein
MAAAPKVSLLMMVVWLSASPAQIPSESEPECNKQGVGKLQLTREDTTILGLTIGSASLKDVEAELGPANVLPRIESSPDTICYVSPTDGTVLIFGAGAMGGFVDVTDFAIWSHEAKFPNASACLPSKLVSRSLSTPSGIKLGLSVEQLSAIVGTVPTTKHAEVHYELSCREKMTAEDIKRFKTAKNWDVPENPFFDVSSFVKAQFTSSKASRIYVAKLESY